MAESADRTRRVCVFCGSNAGARADYATAARELGAELVRRGYQLVFGGGSVGLMGIIADAVMSAGGHVIGVIPQHLVDREVGHNGVSELRVVESMHERKATMHSLSDAFIAMPGGMGTLEELFEVITWSQLELHRDPIAILNIAGYYDTLASFIDRSVADGFVRPAHRDMITIETSVAPLMDAVDTGLG